MIEKCFLIQSELEFNLFSQRAGIWGGVCCWLTQHTHRHSDRGTYMFFCPHIVPWPMALRASPSPLVGLLSDPLTTHPQGLG